MNEYRELLETLYKRLNKIEKKQQTNSILKRRSELMTFIILLQSAILDELNIRVKDEVSQRVMELEKLSAEKYDSENIDFIFLDVEIKTLKWVLER
jgi:predicted transcriptional regulator